MAQIPKTLKKIREARFFLARLREAKGSVRLDKEDFDFYLSAFLSAGRSVTFALQAEQKGPYDAWYPSWEQSLSERDCEVLRFMNSQRVAELKREGAEVYPVIEYVPVTELGLGNQSHPAYGITCWGPPGVPPPTFGRKAHYFETGGTRREVIETCERYLELLEQLAREFGQAYPDN